MAEIRDPMLLVSSETELAPGEVMWGTGGWLPPEKREALDWLTLGKMLGWAVTVTRLGAPGLHADLGRGSRWVVVACDPDRLDEQLIGRLGARLDAEPLLVVARAGSPDRPIARLAGAARFPDPVAGRSLGWLGPGAGRRWSCRKPFEARALQLSRGAAAWATLDGQPIIASRSVGRGHLASLGFHPSEARDQDGAGTALLKHLLVWGAGAPVAWHDLEGGLVLRMDDPGGSQNVHLRSWSYPKLGETEWEAIGAELTRRDGRLSIAYVSGWVDDGDSARGSLTVDGRPVTRVPGQVYSSPLVRYHDVAGLAPGRFHDYESEYRSIQALRARGLVDVELHGYTHMHPDPVAWAKAADRHEATSWFRELGPAAETAIAGLPRGQHPLALGVAAIRRYFDVLPTTVIFPGDEFTNKPIKRALGLGLRLVSSYYQAVRDGDRFCWTQHIVAPYLDEADASWFEAGFPVVGYFHDRDLAVNGVGWFSDCLDRWQAAGARRLLDFRELASIIGRSLSLEDGPDGPCLTAAGDGAPALVRPAAVEMRWPGRDPPSRLNVRLDGCKLSVDVERLPGELGRVIVSRLPGSRGPIDTESTP